MVNGKVDLLLNVVQSVFVRYPPCEVLATCIPIVPPEPICVKEPVRGEEAERVEVETPNTPAPPFDSKRLLEDGCEVVASPAQVMFGVRPPDEKIGAVAVTEVRYEPAT